MSSRQKQRQTTGRMGQSGGLMSEAGRVPSAPSSAQAPMSSQAVPSNTSITTTEYRPPRKPTEEDRRRKRLAFMLFAGALSLAAIASTLGEFEGSSRSGAVSLDPQGRTLSDVLNGPRPKTYDDRVLEHKNKTGYKMNRDRIRMQHENMRPAPLEGSYAAPARDPVLQGLPLRAERHPYGQQPVDNPHTPSLESSIQSSIQAERDAELRLQREREAYIEEFKANARAMGYKVKIDQNYNVEYAPLSEADREAGRGEWVPGSGGAAD